MSKMPKKYLDLVGKTFNSTNEFQKELDKLRKAYEYLKKNG